MSGISCQLSHSSYTAVVWCSGFPGGRLVRAQNGHSLTEAGIVSLKGDDGRAAEVKQGGRWAP